ncbi:hypothetical protein ISCGN_012522 [Ixodes scapularis]
MATADIAASQLTNIFASILSQDMKISLKRDDQGGKWITPGKPRKSRLPADFDPELHVVIVHFPVRPAGAAALPLDSLPAFLQAAQLPAHTCTNVSLHLRQNNRPPHPSRSIVNWLLRITNITLQNTSPPVHSYLAAPNNSCRGVIRGIASEATPDEIINDLESYQGDILHARRVGTTGSAIITFIGTHVPYTVYYRRLEFRCRPHKPRAHHCNSCVEYGHRTLASPGNQRRCPPCSTTLARPDEPHPCTPWFALLQLAVWFSNRALGPE